MLGYKCPDCERTEQHLSCKKKKCVMRESFFRTIQSMVKEGLVKIEWDEEKQDYLWSSTEKGRKQYEAGKKKN